MTAYGYNAVGMILIGGAILTLIAVAKLTRPIHPALVQEISFPPWLFLSPWALC